MIITDAAESEESNLLYASFSTPGAYITHNATEQCSPDHMQHTI